MEAMAMTMDMVAMLQVDMAMEGDVIHTITSTTLLDAMTACGMWAAGHRTIHLPPTSPGTIVDLKERYEADVHLLDLQPLIMAALVRRICLEIQRNGMVGRTRSLMMNRPLLA